MKKNKKRNVIVTGMIAALALATVGCGAKGNKAQETEEDGVEHVIVGTGNAYEPYCYLDDDGNLAGYEYEVLKAVDDLLPQYSFSYQTSDFANVLISLDAGKIDIAAHQYEKNDEREEKYLFGKEAYTTYITYITVLADREDIQSLDDLQGHKVKTETGSNSAYVLDEYNKEHTDNPIEVDLVDNNTDEETLAGMKNGLWDAIVSTKRDVDKINGAYGDGTDVYKTVGEPVQTSSTYFLFDKENTKLQEAVDGALSELKQSGKLAQISTDVIGGDYTESE